MSKITNVVLKATKKVKSNPNWRSFQFEVEVESGQKCFISASAEALLERGRMSFEECWWWPAGFKTQKGVKVITDRYKSDPSLNLIRSAVVDLMKREFKRD